MKKTNWYKEAIIYQVYPLSFKDSNNDGYGDIKGIISKLDHIKELGATAIWFSPLYESPFKDFGYDIKDYYKIDSRFGTFEDFKELINECHKRKLKVIMDMVFNHTSSEHEWFKKALNGDSKYKDFYIFRKGIRKGNKLYPPTNYQSSFTGSAWERVKDSDEFYLHIFTKDQPDLNWDNIEVRKEAANILNFYMENGVDGFRFDVFNLLSKAKGLPQDKRLIAIPRGSKYFVDGPHMHEYLKELNKESLSKYDSYTVGESYMPSEKDSILYQSEKENELNSMFDFSIFKSDTYLGLGVLKKKFNIIEFKNGFFNPQYKYYNSGWNTLVLENHDNARCLNRFGLDSYKYHFEAATMLPTLMYLGFGIPYIYQGQECGIMNPIINDVNECVDPVSKLNFNLLKKLGLSDRKANSCIRYGARDNARVPLAWNNNNNLGFNEGATPWTNLKQDNLTYNIEDDKKSEKSIYKYYQRLLKLKKENKAFIYGSIKEYNHNDKNIVSYIREYNNEKYIVICNFKNKIKRASLPKDIVGKKIELVLSNYSAIAHKKGLILKPYQAIVLKVK